MHRADIVTTAAKLRESVAHIEKREAEIARMERIRDAVNNGSDNIIDNSVAIDLVRLLAPIKGVVVDELNRQIAVKTADMEALQMSPQGAIIEA